MPEYTVFDSQGKKIRTCVLDDKKISEKTNKELLYQVINCYRAAGRRGTHKTKKRDEVRGGGRKPWRQKGTGRARTGSIRNPIWRGGGVIFGPVSRSYTYNVPKKAKHKALWESIKSKLQSDKYVILDTVSLSQPKTKEMVSLLKNLKIRGKCLLIVDEVDDKIRLASKNIPGFAVKALGDANALEVVAHETLAISESALKRAAGISRSNRKEEK